MLAESKRGYDKRREKLLSELRSVSLETILKNLKLSGGKISEKILLNSFSTYFDKKIWTNAFCMISELMLMPTSISHLFSKEYHKFHAASIFF